LLAWVECGFHRGEAPERSRAGIEDTDESNGDWNGNGSEKDGSERDG
jgi:hypothetical protein